MKKILVVLIFTISLSAQNYFKDSDQFIAYTEYADSIIGLVKPPKAPDQIELLELFGMDEKEEQKARTLDEGWGIVKREIAIIKARENKEKLSEIYY